MSGPAPQIERVLAVGEYEYPVSVWRQILRDAAEALRQNPDDTEAREAATVARQAFQQYVRDLAGEASAASEREDAEVRSDPYIAALMGFSQGATFGLGDEARGAVAALGALVPGGESPGEAYRRATDVGRETARDFRRGSPAASIAGDIAGTIASGAGLGGAVTRAVPRLGRMLAAGGEVRGLTHGAPLLTRLGSGVAGAALGAGEGALRAVGSTDGSLSERLENAPLGAVGGAVVGGVGTYTGNAILRGIRKASRFAGKYRGGARAASGNGDGGRTGLAAMIREWRASRNMGRALTGDPEAISVVEGTRAANARPRTGSGWENDALSGDRPFLQETEANLLEEAAARGDREAIAEVTRRGEAARAKLLERALAEQRAPTPRVMAQEPPPAPAPRTRSRPQRSGTTTAQRASLRATTDADLEPLMEAQTLLSGPPTVAARRRLLEIGERLSGRGVATLNSAVLRNEAWLAALRAQ